MSSPEIHYVVLFRSVSHAMKAEKLLIKSMVPHKLIPVPKNISSDCGICLKFRESDLSKIQEILEKETEYMEIRSLL